MKKREEVGGEEEEQKLFLCRNITKQEKKKSKN